MSFSVLVVRALVLGSLFLGGCSSSEGGTTPPAVAGSITLEGVSAKRATSVLRFNVTVKNTTAKGIKTLDSFEIDTAKGPKTASNIRACDSGQTAPWLVKAGGSATIEFTLRSNGPDRQVVEGTCVDGSGKPAGQTSLWEFQTFVTIDTNGGDPFKFAMNGTLDDGAIWTAVGSE